MTPLRLAPGRADHGEPVDAACRRLGSPGARRSLVGRHRGDAYGGNAVQPYTPGIPPGSFGPTPMNGDFFVELTEPMQRSAPARYSTNRTLLLHQLTATSIGITQPVFPGAATRPRPRSADEGVETRARADRRGARSSARMSAGEEIRRP